MESIARFARQNAVTGCGASLGCRRYTDPPAELLTNIGSPMETSVKPYKSRKEGEAVLRNCVGHHLAIPNLRSSGLPGSRPRVDRGSAHHRAALSSLRLRTFNEFKQLMVSSLLVQFFDSDTITLIPVLLDQHANGLGVRVLVGACGLLWRSCGNPKLSRRDADDPLEVKLASLTSGQFSDSRKNSLKVRKLQQELARRVLLVTLLKKNADNLIALLSKT